MTLILEFPMPGLPHGATSFRLVSDNRLSGNTLVQPTATESRWPSTLALQLHAVQCLSDLLRAAELSVTIQATTN